MSKVFQPNNLSPTTTKGDIIVRGDTSDTRLPIGANGTVFTADSTTSLGGTWMSITPGVLGVTSVSSAFTATTANNLILCTGGSFAVTLPNAIGNAGFQIQIIKDDSTLSNPYSIKGATTTQLVGGQAGLTLSTLNESYKLFSDNSNWKVMEHLIPSNWATYTPGFGAGFGTATFISGASWREGDMLAVNISFQTGTVAAATAVVSIGYGGTNANLQVDAARISASNNSNVGQWQANNGSVQGGVLALAAFNTFNLYFGVNGAGSGLSSVFGNAIANSNSKFAFFAKVPIKGWQG